MQTSPNSAVGTSNPFNHLDSLVVIQESVVASEAPSGIKVGPVTLMKEPRKGILGDMRLLVMVPTSASVDQEKVREIEPLVQRIHALRVCLSAAGLSLNFEWPSAIRPFLGKGFDVNVIPQTAGKRRTVRKLTPEEKESLLQDLKEARKALAEGAEALFEQRQSFVAVRDKVRGGGRFVLCANARYVDDTCPPRFWSASISQAQKKGDVEKMLNATKFPWRQLLLELCVDNGNVGWRHCWTRPAMSSNHTEVAPQVYLDKNGEQAEKVYYKGLPVLHLPDSAIFPGLRDYMLHALSIVPTRSLDFLGVAEVSAEEAGLAAEDLCKGTSGADIFRLLNFAMVDMATSDRGDRRHGEVMQLSKSQARAVLERMPMDSEGGVEVRDLLIHLCEETADDNLRSRTADHSKSRAPLWFRNSLQFFLRDKSALLEYPLMRVVQLVYFGVVSKSLQHEEAETFVSRWENEKAREALLQLFGFWPNAKYPTRKTAGERITMADSSSASYADLVVDEEEAVAAHKTMTRRTGALVGLVGVNVQARDGSVGDANMDVLMLGMGNSTPDAPATEEGLLGLSQAFAAAIPETEPQQPEEETEKPGVEDDSAAVPASEDLPQPPLEQVLPPEAPAKAARKPRRKKAAAEAAV